MSLALRPTNCKRCGKSLSMFEGKYCLECQREIDKETEIYEGNTGVFDEPYPWRPNDIIGILKHIIEVADTNSCGVKEIDGIDEEAINNAITIIGSYEQIKWERDIAIAQLKELGYEFGEKIRKDDCISRQAVLEKQYRIDDSATLSTRDVVNVEDIEEMPSVTPTDSKELETIKMQIKSLGEEMRITQKAIKDDRVMIGFNMAVALCNNHIGGE